MSEHEALQQIRDDNRNEDLARYLHRVYERREAGQVVVTPWDTLSTWRQREWRVIARSALEFIRSHDRNGEPR